MGTYTVSFNSEHPRFEDGPSLSGLAVAVQLRHPDGQVEFVAGHIEDDHGLELDDAALYAAMARAIGPEIEAHIRRRSATGLLGSDSSFGLLRLSIAVVGTYADSAGPPGNDFYTFDVD